MTTALGDPRITFALALLAGILALGPLRLIMTRDEAEDLVPTLPGTARMVGLYGLLLALGLAFG